MNYRRPIIAAGLLLALLPIAALAEQSGTAQQPIVITEGPVTLRASVDRREAQVAEPIRLRLEVAAPQGTRVELPKLAGHLGEFEVRGSDATNDIPSADNATSRLWRLEATLETIKTGNLTIPPLDVHYATHKDASTFKTLSTRSITVRVVSVLENRADPTKFRDIKDTVDVPVPTERSYAWLGLTTASVGAAAIAALLTLAVVKRRRGPSAAQWALAALADLEQLPIKSGADAEAAYNEVVDVLREFFELEFGIPTLARTTREFLAQAVQVVGLADTPRQRLTSIASIADEVKFARLGVGEPQVRQAIDEAQAIVAECEAHSRAAAKEAV